MNNANNHMYPFAPGFRTGAPETSAAAAWSMTNTAQRVRDLVLRYIAACGPTGATADEVEEGLNLERRSGSPRISELFGQNLIMRSGLTRLGKSGRKQTVWVLPQYAAGVATPMQVGGYSAA